MGWTVLYIAFGIVALWLLGEVLLQYKARLRWRILAFVGFLGVVVGVIIPSVVVIAIGAVAFAIGQTYVTLSFRRGFAAGWALSTGRPRENRRRRGGRGAAAEPTLEVSGLEAVPATDEGGYGPQDTAADHRGGGGYPSDDGYPSGGGYPSADGYLGADGGYGQAGDHQGGYAAQAPYGDAAPYGSPEAHGDPYDPFGGPSYADAYAAADAAQVYAPQPLPDDTGQYGVYSADARPGQHDHPDRHDHAAQDPYGGGYYQPAAAQDGYADPYGMYGDGQGDRSAYGDPYGDQQYGAPYGSYDPADPYGQGGYAQQPYGGDPYQQQYYENAPETPPGGVWVPQQRDGGYPPEPPHQPDPHQGYPPYQQGYDEQQYRY